MTADNDNTQAIIFFDLDGVLADFDRWAPEQGKIKPNGKIDWDALDHDWWASMPPCTGAKDAYDAAKKLGIVKFLTAGSMSADSLSGKADWVQKFVPEKGKFILRDLITCSSADKYLVATPNRILIDDRASNIDEWTAAGGIGILHKGDFKETLQALELAVNKLTATIPNAHLPDRKSLRKNFGRAPGM